MNPHDQFVREENVTPRELVSLVAKYNCSEQPPRKGHDMGSRRREHLPFSPGHAPGLRSLASELGSVLMPQPAANATPKPAERSRNETPDSSSSSSGEDESSSDDASARRESDADNEPGSSLLFSGSNLQRSDSGSSFLTQASTSSRSQTSQMDVNKKYRREKSRERPSKNPPRSERKEKKKRAKESSSESEEEHKTKKNKKKASPKKKSKASDGKKGARTTTAEKSTHILKY